MRVHPAIREKGKGVKVVLLKKVLDKIPLQTKPCIVLTPAAAFDLENSCRDRYIPTIRPNTKAQPPLLHLCTAEEEEQPEAEKTRVTRAMIPAGTSSSEAAKLRLALSVPYQCCIVFIHFWRMGFVRVGQDTLLSPAHSKG